MDRRALLAGSAAGLWAASARAQQACFDRMDCFDTQIRGPSLDLQFTAGVLDPRITFTRASVATYFDVAGVLQTAGTNVARFDYDPVTHVAKGLLIEEARTNLLLNSATLGTQSVTVTAAATTLSFYGTGTVTLSGTFAGSLVGSGVFPTRSTLTFTPTAGSLTCTVTGSVLNAQVETGAFATSWISTAGATATRAADVATVPVGSWFNSSAGSLAAVGSMQGVSNPSIAPVLAELDDGTITNALNLRVVAGTTNFAASDFVANALITNLIAGSGVASGVTVRGALAYGAGSLGAALNGAASVSASVALPSGITNLALGAGRSSGCNGYLSRVRYWPRALSGPELQAVTQ